MLARIVLRGGVSQDDAQQVRGLSSYLALIGARASMTGLITPDSIMPAIMPGATTELAR